MNVAGIEVGQDQPFFLIAGPCVLESESQALSIAAELARITSSLGIPFVFKASFDKANRTSLSSFRGPGLERGLVMLERIRSEISVPVLTDVHERTPLEAVAAVVDVLQTPALLCRQTDFIRAVASQGLPVNLKKGQFLSPAEMRHVVDKARSTGNERLLVCERGTSFGYNDLVVDMRAIEILGAQGQPVVFDATHSVQQPGLLHTRSGGLREFVPALARAAVAVGVAGVFMETHPDPDAARCDGPNAWPLDRMEPLLGELRDIDALRKSRGGQQPAAARASWGETG